MLPIFQFRSQPKKSLAAIAIGCLVLFIISGVSTTRLLAISPDPEAVIRVVPGEMREDEFDVDFRLDTGGTAISGIHVHVTHSPNLELKQGSAEGSMFSQSVLEPEETKSDGSFEFVRLRFDEGFADEESVVPSTNGESTAPEEQRLPIILIVALTGGVAFFMVIAALFAGMVWGLRNSSSPPPQT